MKRCNCFYPSILSQSWSEYVYWWGKAFLAKDSGSSQYDSPPYLCSLFFKSWLNNHSLEVNISLGGGLYWEGHSQCDCDADWWTLDRPFLPRFVPWFPLISPGFLSLASYSKFWVCAFIGEDWAHICWQPVLHSSQFPQISTLSFSFSFLFFHFRILSGCLYWGRLITFAMGDCKELIGGASFPHFLSICFIYQVTAKGGPTHIAPFVPNIYQFCFNFSPSSQ